MRRKEAQLRQESRIWERWGAAKWMRQKLQKEREVRRGPGGSPRFLGSLQLRVAPPGTYPSLPPLPPPPALLARPQRLEEEGTASIRVSLAELHHSLLAQGKASLKRSLDPLLNLLHFFFFACFLLSSPPLTPMYSTFFLHVCPLSFHPFYSLSSPHFAFAFFSMELW